jgi:hypothetical protein
VTQLDTTSPAPPPPTPPLSAERAIALCRRWRVLAFAINLVIGVLFVSSLMLAGRGSEVGMLGIVVVPALWFWHLMSSAHAVRVAMRSHTLIEEGAHDEAERQLAGVMRGFTLIRHGKVIGLQHLALLRHSQHNWADTIALSRELLQHQITLASKSNPDIERSTRLILTDALLESNRADEAGQQLALLQTLPMTLNDQLAMTLLRLEHQAQTGQWPLMMSQMKAALDLAEIMPPAMSARTCALLALAAKNTGRADWQSHLTQRVRLLVDAAEFVKHRPALATLFAPAN